eukprot:TRINITY_DN1308_c0_g1_i6.p2 TRINITY_DN1308_c0_g1~~TRINITY_DN1308_c0_g1_i6.p2  ORF type:complete len:103 (+),score=14.69 TRINITY_DN1308_c0_g1_i6:32-310(+)
MAFFLRFAVGSAAPTLRGRLLAARIGEGTWTSAMTLGGACCCSCFVLSRAAAAAAAAADAVAPPGARNTSPASALVLVRRFMHAHARLDARQ